MKDESILYSIDEHWEYTKWKKRVTKGHRLCGSD